MADHISKPVRSLSAQIMPVRNAPNLGRSARWQRQPKADALFRNLSLGYGKTNHKSPSTRPVERLQPKTFQTRRPSPAPCSNQSGRRASQ